jgi:hypothetical protein
MGVYIQWNMERWNGIVEWWNGGIVEWWNDGSINDPVPFYS